MPILNDGDEVRESITIQRNGGTIRGERTVNDVPVYRVYMSSSGDFINESKTALNELFFTEEPKPAPQPAHRFKVGDRVVVSIGKRTGFVSEVDEDDDYMPYHVILDEGGSWWAIESQLSTAPAPEPPKYVPKVGDRVVTEHGNGTVMSFEENSATLICHDIWSEGHDALGTHKELGMTGKHCCWFNKSDIKPINGDFNVR